MVVRIARTGSATGGGPYTMDPDVRAWTFRAASENIAPTHFTSIVYGPPLPDQCTYHVYARLPGVLDLAKAKGVAALLVHLRAFAESLGEHGDQNTHE
jgi:hypothetical protein